MQRTIKILLVDDHDIIRMALRRILGLEEDFEVIGDVSNAEEALTQLKFLSPDIAVIDIKMPGIDGIELTSQLKLKKPHCEVIILSVFSEYLPEALEAGASGYFLKDIKGQELIEAIRRVHDGEIVIAEEIMYPTLNEPTDKYDY
ncbi:MAG: response regulator transcription factor [Dehalococcoidales bacterium]|nr:response regulator transcription factor [Dehalococcoidales bacterium]